MYILALLKETVVTVPCKKAKRLRIYDFVYGTIWEMTCKLMGSNEGLKVS
jgi:hypothetical protein